MTGITGFVGSHFAYQVLKHSDARIVAIARARADKPARERVLEALQLVAASYREVLDVAAIAARIQVVKGDIEQPQCGVAQTENTDTPEFWHIAASLSYEDKHVAQIRKQNVNGTEHALQLAEHINAKRFVYVSTAYTCGRVAGEIPEVLHAQDRVFNNAYEQSKCDAEHLVARWSERSGRAAAIVRPSIVVGPRRSYSPGGTTSGLYGFAREVMRLKRMLQASGTTLTMLGDAHAPINLIPVDDLVSEMWQLSLSDFAGGFVHHVTSDHVPTVSSLLAVIGELCGNGPIHVAAAREHPPSPVERVIDRRADFYASYLRAPKTFVRRAGRAISLSERELARYVEAYVEERRRASNESVFERALLQTNSGHTLVSHQCGGAGLPSLVLVNAYGLAPELWMPLAKALQQDFRVLTWEQREQIDSVEDHLEDLRALLDHHGIERAFVAGYCTGADLALQFAALHPERVHAVLSVSGALNLVDAEQTPFQINMRRLAQSASRDLEHAQLYHQLLFGNRRGHYGMLASERSDEAMLASMVSTLDPALLHITSAPFRDPESLHHYARTMQHHYASAPQRGVAQVKVPVLLVVSGRDEVAHPAASRAALALLDHATLVELPDADHFAVYSEPAIAEVLRYFMLRHGKRALRPTVQLGAVVRVASRDQHFAVRKQYRTGGAVSSEQGDRRVETSRAVVGFGIEDLDTLVPTAGSSADDQHLAARQ